MIMLMNGKKTWTSEHDCQLMELKKAGKKPKEIALIMGRGITTIYYKSTELERKTLKINQRKVRRCLGGCNKDFESSSPGNRICPNCIKRDRSGVVDPVAIPSMGIN